jgi:hypothetical protein
MSHIATGHNGTEDAILNFEVSDDVLETAGETGKERVALYTVPSAIICLPLAPARSKDWS